MDVGAASHGVEHALALLQQRAFNGVDLQGYVLDEPVKLLDELPPRFGGKNGGDFGDASAGCLSIKEVLALPVNRRFRELLREAR